MGSSRQEGRNMPTEEIIIRGAKVHNLKSINLRLPRNKLIVITGHVKFIRSK